MSRQPQNPVSFKTVPGRNRTQKWQQAKTYNYDGDDWGEYDPYDEYGGPAESPQAQAPVQQSHGHGTQPATRGERSNSFARDDERRYFSAGAPSLQFERQYAPRVASESRAQYADQPSFEDTTHRGRPSEFPEAPSTIPTASTSGPMPPSDRPPRKSSLSRAPEADTTVDYGAAESPRGMDKPLPFIRPSDIYKRTHEERERSHPEEDGRPSLESIQRDIDPLVARAVSSSPRYLETVTESRESRMFMDDEIPQEQMTSRGSASDTSPSLPPVSRFSGFGTDLFSTSAAHAAGRGSGPGLQRGTVVPDSTVSESRADALELPVYDASMQQSHPNSLQHQPSSGIRSAVHTAFEHSEAGIQPSPENSQPASSIAAVDRSNTTSTSGISPIISRVPSAITSQPLQSQRSKHEQMSPMPEPALVQAEPASSGHKRNTSGEDFAPRAYEPGYRRSLDPPSNGSSPARTPALAAVDARRLSNPMTAEVMAADHITGTTVPYETANLPVDVSQSHYELRESDLAKVISTSPDKDEVAPIVAEVERSQREAFLKSHTPSAAPASAVPPVDGRNSPTKSRVRELADNYQELHNAARRGSTTSIESSWSQFRGSEENLPRALAAASQKSSAPQMEVTPATDATPTTTIRDLATPTSSNDSRPIVNREPSFNPQMPGGWIASSVPTPAAETRPFPEGHLQSSVDNARNQAASPLSIAPTTKKVPLVEILVDQQSSNTQNPLDAVKEAGAQLGAALMSSMGLSHNENDHNSAGEHDHVKSRTRGALDVPAPLHRSQTDTSEAATSVMSSQPPTPPAKDTPLPAEDHPSAGRSNEYFENTVAPLRIRPQSQDLSSLQLTSNDGQPESSSYSAGDSHNEIDRLSREIVLGLDDTRDMHAGRQQLDTRPRQTDNALTSSFGIVNKMNSGASIEPAKALSIANTGRLGMLDQRFSWEAETPSVAVPQSARDVHEIPSPEIKPETEFERPRNKELHVVNTNISIESPVEEREPAAAQSIESSSKVYESKGRLSFERPSQDVGKTSLEQHDRAQTPRSPSVSQSISELGPSPISNRTTDMSGRLPSYYYDPTTGETINFPSNDNEASRPSVDVPLNDSQGENEIPKDNNTSTIPPFRTILALKSSQERIGTYDATRSTFAGMNTGLRDWLSEMLERYPEHMDLVTEDGEFKALTPIHTSIATSGFGTLKRVVHKQSPSFGMFNTTGGERTFSSGSQNPANAPSHTTPTGESRGGALDMDRVQQRGKEFMKSAGVFGGKAQAGAKGLLAKGRSRFGGRGDKNPISNTAIEKAVSTHSAESSPAQSIFNASVTIAPQTQSSKHDHPNESPVPALIAAPVASIDRTLLSLQGGSSSTGSLPSYTLFVDQTDKLSQTTSNPATNKNRDESRPRMGRNDSADGTDSKPRSRSRPMSQVFARLRNRSGSSKDGQEGESGEKRRIWRSSRSRPRSLALVDSNINTSNSAFSAHINQMDNVDQAVLSPVTTPGRRLELWEQIDPSDTDRSMPVTERELHVGRMGVLPSPAPTTETFEYFGPPAESDRGRRRTIEDVPVVQSKQIESSPVAGEMNAVAQPGQDPQHLANTFTQSQEDNEAQAATTPALRQPVGEHQNASSSRSSSISQISRVSTTHHDVDQGRFVPSPVQAESPLEVPVEDGRPAWLNKEWEGSTQAWTEETTARPQQQRRVSGLASLPSQRRFSQILQSESRFSSQSQQRDADVETKKPDSDTDSGEVDHDLYDSTPIALRSLWLQSVETPPIASANAPSRGSTPKILSDGRTEGVSSVTTTAETEPHRPSERTLDHVEASRDTPLDQDRREQHATNVEMEQEPDSIISPRSSISSLHSADGQDEIATMSAHAEPAGPIDDNNLRLSGHGDELSIARPVVSMSSIERLEYEKRFAERSYSRDDVARYNTQPTTLHGSENETTAQEIDLSEPYNAPLQNPAIGTQGNTTLVHGSAHRLNGAVQPTEYERMRSAPSHAGAEASQPPDETTNRRSRRLSIFFRNKTKAPASEQSSAPAPPAASQIHDHHGLEDVDAYEAAVRDVRASPPATDSPQVRQRSGIWDAFSSRRMSTVSRPDVDESSSRLSTATGMTKDFFAGDGQSEVRTNPELLGRASRRATLKKQQPSSSSGPVATTKQIPQRAVSSAGELEQQKKKRMSGFGSLFRRSGTTGHANAKTNRLSKLPPAERVKGTENFAGRSAMASNVVLGNVRGYEAYEDARHANRPTTSLPSQRTRPIATMRTVSGPVGALRRVHDQAEYRPSTVGANHEFMQPTLPVLHPERDGTQQDTQTRNTERQTLLQFDNIPEAFRPVEASYNQQVQPIGPPPEHTSQMLEFYAPRSPDPSVVASARQQRGSSTTSTDAYGLQRQRQASTASQSSMPSFPPPEEHNIDPRARGRTPISPQIDTDFVDTCGPRSGNMPSLSSSGDYDVARSPAREYGDQQTPWLIGLPSDRVSGGGTRNSMAQPNPTFQANMGSSRQPPAHLVYSPDYYSAYSQEARPPTYIPRTMGYAPRLANTYDNDPRQHTYMANADRAPPPPPHAYNRDTAYAVPSFDPREGDQYDAPLQWAFRERQVSHGDERPYHRRMSSTYSGRRDDPAFGEEDLFSQMKGSSYPGQEWSPTVHDRE